MSASARPGVSTDERRARIARRHRLLPSERTDDVVAIADDLVALHSSDPTTVYLSAFTRMQNPSVESVDSALYVDRSLIRHHAMRRTIWVMSRAVAAAANASSTLKVAAGERKKVLQWLDASDDVDNAERWLNEATARVVDHVAAKGAAFTREIGEQLPELNIGLTAAPGTKNATQVQAHTRVPLLAAMEGRLVRARPAGSWVSGQYSWAVLTDWLNGNSLEDDDVAAPDAATTDMVNRVLDRFGPMTADDLQWWTGWTKTQTRKGLADAEAVEVDLDDGVTGWVRADDPSLDSSPTDEVGPWVAILPSLDPTTMGWKQRGWYVDDRLVPRLFDRFGNAGPTVWADGRVVGGWAQCREGQLAVELHEDLAAEHIGLIEEELIRLHQAIGDTRYSIRFPSPCHKDLVA
jgi:hypothetical protein